jgi:hypothetical protein
MELDVYLILGIWLLIGAISAILVFLDMRHRKRMEPIWALLCIPLSAIGFFVYFLRYEKVGQSGKGRELPPKPDYGKPEYKFKEEPKPKPVKETPKAVVAEPEPVVEAYVEPVAEPAYVPEPEPVAEPTPVEPVQEEAVFEPPAEPVKPVEAPQPVKPKKAQIEGIPRCPECGAAVSSYDDTCPGCGNKLKE